MKNILIFDTETTGIDPKKDKAIELGAVLWNIEHRSIVECYSCLANADENAAEVANCIPVGMLRDAQNISVALEQLKRLAGMADAVVAHNCAFDRAFVAIDLPWICTIEDIIWPRPSVSKSLTNLALAHGVAVVSAHRAIHDCLLLARCFESIPDIGDRLFMALDHSTLPKAEVHSLAPFEQKDLVKEHGFHWDPMRRIWHRTMAVADAKKLPFSTRVVA
jgi:DNA polymerase III subunit epsilon